VSVITEQRSEAQANRAGTTPRRLAIVPAYNEEGSLGTVLEEITAADPDFGVVVIDDASIDSTGQIAAAAGVPVVRLPYNIGIGGAMQTGYQFARERGFDVAVQVDADGQHDPRELSRLLEPILAGEADLAVGTRFAGEGNYRATPGRRIGMHLFAAATLLLTGRRLTDPTSGFRAVNRRGIELFAAEYPHDFPEVESNILAAKHSLRVVEVPVKMRPRAAGRSSVTTLRGTYFVIRILVALFVSAFRRYPKRLEEA
jgi:glycosyltransferase involved in cell wall biosynthesis